jgi:hypothetical protein
MQCKNEQTCSGSVDITQEIPVRTGCTIFTVAHPCGTCKRLHWGDGNPLRSRSGLRVFLDGSNLSQRDKDGVENFRHPIER